MKENKYDEEKFFAKYSEMDRSRKGLQAAGEWSELQKLLPDFAGKKVLDLGCGYGWHCRYAAEQGAVYVLGTDISKKCWKKRVPEIWSPASNISAQRWKIWIFRPNLLMW